MSRTELTDAELAARVAAALRAKAGRVTTTAEPFDASSPMLAVDQLGQPRRRHWARPVMAAAGVLLVATAAAAVATRSRDDGGDRTRSGPSEPQTQPTPAGPSESQIRPAPSAPAAPDGALAPGWLPDGLTLWSVTWSSGAQDAALQPNQQLFTAADGGGVLIDIQAANPGSSSGGDPVTVRGVEGSLLPAKEFPDDASTIFWEEDASLSATFTGMTLDSALAVLDNLQWRSADHKQGFAPPTEGPLTLAGETSDAAPVPVVSTAFQYADESLTLTPGDSRQLTVRTSSATGGTSSDLLAARLHGEQRGDGAVESYDPAYGTLSVVWPDGRRYWIDANATPLGRDELRRVADEMTELAASDLEELRDGVETRIEGLPAVAETALPSGRVTVRGSGSSATLCLAVAGEQRCANPVDDGVWLSADVMGTGFVIDGAWFVVAAATPTAAPPTIVASGAGDPADLDSIEWGPGIVGEAATDSGWAMVLAQPAAGIDIVLLDLGGGDQQVVERPNG
jgi:hypothetical protein